MFLEHFDHVAVVRNCSEDPGTIESRKVATEVFEQLISAAADDPDGDNVGTFDLRYRNWLQELHKIQK